MATFEQWVKDNWPGKMNVREGTLDDPNNQAIGVKRDLYWNNTLLKFTHVHTGAGLRTWKDFESGGGGAKPFGYYIADATIKAGERVFYDFLDWVCIEEHSVGDPATFDPAKYVPVGRYYTPEDSDNSTGFFAGLLTLKANTALLLKTALDRIVSYIKTDVFKVSDVDVSDISEGQFKIPLVQKSGGVPVIQGSSELIDKLAASSVLAQLGDNANWGNVAGKSGDFIKLTGDNSSGELGENSQELYDDEGQYFLCISHILDNPGEATWVRNRSRDSLRIGVTQDNAVIAALENETDWSDITNDKALAVRSKPGSWHKSDVTGYLYHCYRESGSPPDTWYWHRSGLPLTDSMQILNTGDYTELVTALLAHDFAASDYDPAGLAGEKGTQGQKYYHVANREMYECVYDEVNAKLIWIKY